MNVNLIISTAVITILLLVIFFKVKTLKGLFIDKPEIPMGAEINQPNIVLF